MARRRPSISEAVPGIAGELAPALAALTVLLGVTLGARGDDLLPSPDRMAVVLAVPIVMLIAAYTRRNAVVVGFILVAGFLLRWADFFPGGGSDTLNSVTEGIETFLSGGNPYHHYYETSRPPGQAVPYPPFQFILHFPGWLFGGYDGVRMVELAAAMGVMGLLALVAHRARLAGLVGLALYAGLPNLINLSADGGNDTSAGFMVLLAIVVVMAASRRGMAGRSAAAAGVAVALALATKQSTLPYMACLSAYVIVNFGPARRRFVAAGAVTLIACVLPFLPPDPTYFLHGVTTLGVHDIAVYGWNVSVLLSQLGLPVPDPAAATAIATLATLLAFVAAMPLVRRGLGHAVLAGAFVTLAMLLSGQWTTYSYFALALTPLCALPALLELDVRRPPRD